MSLVASRQVAMAPAAPGRGIVMGPQHCPVSPSWLPHGVSAANPSTVAAGAAWLAHATRTPTLPHWQPSCRHTATGPSSRPQRSLRPRTGPRAQGSGTPAAAAVAVLPETPSSLAEVTSPLALLAPPGSPAQTANDVARQKPEQECPGETPAKSLASVPPPEGPKDPLTRDVRREMRKRGGRKRRGMEQKGRAAPAAAHGNKGPEKEQSAAVFDEAGAGVNKAIAGEAEGSSPAAATAVEDGDPIEKLEALGPNWWGVAALSGTEHHVKAAIERLFAAQFQGHSVEAFAPRIRQKSMRSKTKAVVLVAVLMRCTMTRQLYDALRGLEGVYGFIGHQETFRGAEVVVPAAIPETEIEKLRQTTQEDAEVLGKGAQKGSTKESKAEKGGKEPDTMAADEGGKNERAGSEERAKGGNVVLPRSSTANVNVPPASSLKAGMYVRVTKGPYMSLVGILRNIDTKAKAGEVVVDLLCFTEVIHVRLNHIQGIIEPEVSSPVYVPA